MTLYPNGIDSSLQLLDPAIDGYVAAINATDDAVIAIETELGLDPKGIYSDVATRLSILEGRIGPGATITGGPIDINDANLAGVLAVDKGGTGLNLASSAANPDEVLMSTGAGIAYNLIANVNVDPAAAIAVSKLAAAGTDGYTITTVVGVPTWSNPSSFTVGGDVSGTVGNQTVNKIKGKNLSTSLSTIGAMQDGYSLNWVNASTEWQAKPAPSGSFSAGGDLSGSSSSQTVIAIQNVPVNATIPTDGYVLTYDLADGYWHASPPAAPQSIIFKPGSTSIGNIVATWTEVVTHINAANGLLDVYVDASLATPTVSASVDCKGRTRFIGIERYVVGGSNSTQLDVPDGFIITNPASFYGLTLSCTGNAVIIALTITSAQTTFECTSIYMSMSNNTPIITIVVNDATIRFVRSVVFANAPGAAAVIDTGTGVSLYVTVQLIEGQPFSSLPTLAFIGDSQLYVQTDGSAFLPAQALYTGIQGESHLLKTQNDTTANRPVVGFSGGPTDGQMYFDTTLGKPIWYFGGSWVDATGAVV